MDTVPLPKFQISAMKNDLCITWRLPGVNSIAQFLYWALEWHARYDVRSPDRHNRHAWLELAPVAGAYGEYTTGLFWEKESGLGRNGFASIHYLVHHGLDGLPAAYFAQLPRDEPIFTIHSPRGTLIHLSLDEWFDHWSNPSNDLDRMAIKIHSRPIERSEPFNL
jgi:hypothetical protein